MKNKGFIFLLLMSNLTFSQIKIDWNKIKIETDTNARLDNILKEKRDFQYTDSPDKLKRKQKTIDSTIKLLKPFEFVIYNLYYPDQYRQNCSFLFYSDSTDKYIYNSLNLSYDEYTYNEKQRKWIQENKLLIISKINGYLKLHQLTRMMAKLILENHLHECIPELINTYNRQSESKDYLILSLLYSIVDEGEFPDKTQTVTYNYFKSKSNSEKHLEANQYSIDEIIKLSEEYYKFKIKR